MQHHYVLVYDDETKKWSVDVETCDAVFHESAIFDGFGWVYDVSPELRQIYLDKEEALANLIDWAQGE